MIAEPARGIVFDVDTFAVHDGPGIRMTVYLKGCPLACAWCHSPESQSPEPESIFLADRCVMCGACVAACDEGVHTVTVETHEMDRAGCCVCGRCVDACPTGALRITGALTRADEIVARAVRMKPFFDHSGGGVTLTGGEVTAQVDFAAAILAGCRKAGIHTAIETCGACAPDRLERLADLSDLVLFDLKLIDDDAHRRWTGVSNAATLDNARRLAGRNVQVRMPLVPGITDTTENIQAVFRFCHEIGLTHVTLLPYNPASAAKYEWVGRAYEIEGDPQSDDQLQALVSMGQQEGLQTDVG